VKENPRHRYTHVQVYYNAIPITPCLFLTHPPFWPGYKDTRSRLHKRPPVNILLCSCPHAIATTPKSFVHYSCLFVTYHPPYHGCQVSGRVQSRGGSSAKTTQIHHQTNLKGGLVSSGPYPQPRIWVNLQEVSSLSTSTQDCLILDTTSAL
jgi:hypothetical protein